MLSYLPRCIPFWIQNRSVALLHGYLALVIRGLTSLATGPEDVPTPAEHGLPYEDLTLDTPDGVKIKSYLLVQRRSLPGDNSLDKETEEDGAEEDRKFAGTRPTILMFHGNAGNIGHRVPLARIFFIKMRCNVILVSYRGYGQSEGSPSEQGFKVDSQTVLDFVRSDPVLKTTPIICYGQSIGGAVSISLAARNPKEIHALVLENTFLSVPRLIPSAIPWLAPFSWLCHQKWDSANDVLKIPRTIPILFLSGVQDEIVPHEHMVTMWNIAIGKMNPDGSPSSSSGTRSDLQRKEGEEGVTKDDPAAIQDKGSRGPATSASPSSLPRKSTTTTPWNMQEAAIDKELDTDLDSDTDGDTREEVEYGIVNDQRVVVSKRTKYRIWREFEKGTHNDTCVQPGYWAAIWEFINSLVPLPADHFTTSSSS
ncbi:hypothetical protein FS842_001109 [Serendipita sp. 407]|nr:hypothetical protein FS842_001109 [Serendipita sp. 407]